MRYWYALQCMSGKEDSLCRLLEQVMGKGSVFFPKRELSIRRGGENFHEIKALFPGYLFFCSAGKMVYSEALELTRKLNQYGSQNILYKILGLSAGSDKHGSDTVTPVSAGEMAQIRELAGENDIVSFSSYVKEGQKVRIINGPLKGMDALIVKVNARKRRIRVALDLFGREHTVDLGACAL